MAHSETATALDLGALLILDVDALLARLPATARAQVEWARRPIHDGIARLRTEPLTDPLVADVGRSCIGPLVALGPHLGALWSSLRDQQAGIMTELVDDRHRLARFLESEDAGDTLAWIVDLLRSAFVRVAAELQEVPEGGLRIGREEAAELGKRSLVVHFYAGLMALMAAADESRVGADRARASDLVDVAFLELMEFRDEARADGFWIESFPTATTAERRERLARDAERVRRTLEPGDWEVIDSGRLRDLR